MGEPLTITHNDASLISPILMCRKNPQMSSRLTKRMLLLKTEGSFSSSFKSKSGETCTKNTIELLVIFFKQ